MQGNSRSSSVGLKWVILSKVTATIPETEVVDESQLVRARLRFAVATKASSVERRPWLVLGWVTIREVRRRCEPRSVRRCGLKSVTDRLYSHHRADTDV